MDMKRKLFAAALLLVMTLQGAAAQAVIGQGPGYHDPRSPFAPLQEKEGILTWELLSSVTTKADKTKLTPVFPAKLLALDKRKVKVKPSKSTHMLTSVGGAGGTPFEAICPAGMVAVGIRGGAGIYIDNLQVVCAPLE